MPCARRHIASCRTRGSRRGPVARRGAVSTRPGRSTRNGSDGMCPERHRAVPDPGKAAGVRSPGLSRQHAAKRSTARGRMAYRREHARLSASVGRTQARLGRRLRDTGETERVGGRCQPSKSGMANGTSRRRSGSAERVRQDTAGPHAGIPSTAQPSRSRPVATQPLLQRRPAAVERLAIEPLQRHIRAEMRDHRAQATDRGQSPTCGCGADDPLKLQTPQQRHALRWITVFQSMTRAAFPSGTYVCASERPGNDYGSMQCFPRRAVRMAALRV